MKKTTKFLTDKGRIQEMKRLIYFYHQDTKNWTDDLKILTEFIRKKYKSDSILFDQDSDEVFLRPLIFENYGGDCDDQAIAFCSWALQRGLKCGFEVVSRQNSTLPEHVWPYILTQNGKQIFDLLPYSLQYHGPIKIWYDSGTIEKSGFGFWTPQAIAAASWVLDDNRGREQDEQARREQEEQARREQEANEAERRRIEEENRKIELAHEAERIRQDEENRQEFIKKYYDRDLDFRLLPDSWKRTTSTIVGPNPYKRLYKK